MRKILASLCILGLALALIWGSRALKENPDFAASGVKTLQADCTPYELRCKLLDPIAKEAENIAYSLKRRDIPKDELPVLRIYMSDGAIGKLQAKRNSVVALPQPIHISNREDWVNGEAIVEYANRKEKSKVSMRLKGDWADHLLFPRKLSLRVKTRGGGYLFGVRTFSVQHPVTRQYAKGALVLEHMRRHDILSPRQKFVDMYVNDIPVGIMNMEEHFGKEMVEAQARREGPILAMNEDPMWDQWHINFNTSGMTDGERENFYGYRDGAIKVFNDAPFLSGTIATHTHQRGESLWRDFIDGHKPAPDVFDYEKLAKYWVLSTVWGGCHSLGWNNRRYYFNPISGLLEPVSFDNNANPFVYEFCMDTDIDAALRDPEFVQVVRATAKAIREEVNADAFTSFLTERQDDYAAYFALENQPHLPGREWMFEPLSPAVFVANLDRLLAELDQHLNSRADAGGPYKTINHGIAGEAFLNEQDDLAMHLTARYFPGGSDGTLQFRNLTLADIELKSVAVRTRKNKPEPLDFTPATLLSQKTKTGVVEVPANISDADLSALKSITLAYDYKGEPLSREVDVQFRQMPDGFAENPLEAIEKVVGTGAVDRADRHVNLGSGTYIFDESIALPKGWRLSAAAGAHLGFRNGALLKINGPVSFIGAPDGPVTVSVESNQTFGQMGAWGGILVSKAGSRSTITHLRLEGTGSQNLKNRQGYYGMTGCLNFNESDVDIAHAEFINAQCEDALNIVKSDFTIDEMRIEGARADAFDSDFSTGVITDSDFIASGNDGIDVSGTLLTLENIRMRDIGDKGVSVGEKSELLATGLDIDGAVIGLVSKDLSRAHVKDASFAGISGTALMSYIKKQEYGPSQIRCEACRFEGDTVLTGQQAGTSIILNGEAVTSGKLTRRQMLEAGLIVEEVSQ